VEVVSNDASRSKHQRDQREMTGIISLLAY